MSDPIKPLQSEWVISERKARDAEWMDAPEAQSLRKRADRIKERLDNGELYEVAF